MGTYEMIQALLASRKRTQQNGLFFPFCFFLETLDEVPLENQLSFMPVGRMAI